MQISQSVMIGVIILLAIGVVILFLKNSKFKEEAQRLNEVLTLKDNTIKNYEKSRVAVKEVLDNIELIDKVMPQLDKKESPRVIADKLNIPLSNIELIIKLHKLKQSKV